MSESQNAMKAVFVEKVVLNCGCGTDHVRLEKSVKLLEKMAGRKPVKTITQQRNATWGLRKGLPVGTKLTLRDEEAIKMVERLVEAKEKQLKPNNFDEHGTVSFGISECIDIPGVEYEPDIGIIGLQATITLARPGFRVKRRRSMKRKLPNAHTIHQEEAIAFMQQSFGVELPSDDEDEDEE